MSVVIEKYGVRLEPLAQEHLEMARCWRNNPKISQYMEYREQITPPMQQKWFESINNDRNLFWIIYFHDEPIGMINMKNIDHSAGEGEGGIYIYRDEYLIHNVGFRAVLAMSDYCFEELGFLRTVAHIMRDNPRAIRFNEMLGYKPVERQDHVVNQLYTLDKEDYLAHRPRIARFCR